MQCMSIEVQHSMAEDHQHHNPLPAGVTTDNIGNPRKKQRRSSGRQHIACSIFSPNQTDFDFVPHDLPNPHWVTNLNRLLYFFGLDKISASRSGPTRLRMECPVPDPQWSSESYWYDLIAPPTLSMPVEKNPVVSLSHRPRSKACAAPG